MKENCFGGKLAALRTASALSSARAGAEAQREWAGGQQMGKRTRNARRFDVARDSVGIWRFDRVSA